jgi:POT family proton-dependent oligopeptide transporter
VSPIGGAILADVKWGRHRTILLSCPLCLLGLAILTGSSTPQALERSLGLPGWILGAALYAIGLGGIKPNLAPLVADQRNHQNSFTKILPSGERVLVDPSLTLSKIYNVYFWFINIGAFSPLAITSAERYVGFWLAFLIPSMIFILVPLTLLISRNRCVRYPPQGSVLLNACKCLNLAFWRVQGDTRIEYSDCWELAKPNYYENLSHNRPLTKAEVKHASKITWTDSFVDEIRQTLRACQIFLFFPVTTGQYILSFSS